MTPQERDLVTALLDRVRQVDTREKDAEAEALIRRMIQEKPDAPYVLAQTVIVQDLALADMQRRLEEAEAKLRDAARPAGGFLGGFLGNRGSTPASPPPGPWSRPAQAGPQQGFPQQGVPQQGFNAQQPGYGAPGYAPGYGAPQQGGGFLRTALTTAAGVAGGALLFQGVSSMFGGGAGHAAAPGADHVAHDAASGAAPGYHQASHQEDPGAGDWGGGDGMEEI